MKGEIARFLDHLAYARGLAANTRAAYGADLDAFFRFLGRQGIGAARDAGRNHIVDFLDAERRRGLAGATLARRLITLKVFFGWLQAEGVLDSNVAEALAAKGFDIDRAAIRMPEGPLKQVGETQLEVSLHADVLANITVAVVAEQ